MASLLPSSVWSAFARKLGVEDAAVLKALTVLEKCNEDAHGPRLDALEALVRPLNQHLAPITKRKAALGDKPFREVRDRLQGMLDEIKTLRIRTEALRDAAAAQPQASERAAVLAQARQRLAGIRQALALSTLLASVEANPFVPVKVQAALNASLAMLATKLT